MKPKSNLKIFTILLAIIIFSTAAFAQKSELSGKWNLLELKANGAAIDFKISKRGDKIPGINFATEKRFGLITGCNGMGADFTADEKGNFKAGAIIGTKMLCGEDLMKIENAMASAAQATTKYSIKNGILVLQDKRGRNIMKFSRAETEANSKEVTLYIAPKKANCAGVAPKKCLQIKEKAGGEWHLFYDTIENFDFQKGFYYILKVKRTQIPNPPKDASKFRWELLEIAQKTKRFVKA